MSTPDADYGGMKLLDTAIAYCRRGWSVIPIPFRSKNPGFPSWEQLRLAEADLAGHFNGHPQNIGVLLGEPSYWVVDVDLDHLRCVEMADLFLPPTPAVFGRPGKPRSHRIYRVSAPVATKKHKSKSAGMLVELRSTGAQTVFPPSTHESGERITWEVEGAEPSVVDPNELLEAVERLANSVKVELGEKPTAGRPNKPLKRPPLPPKSRAERRPSSDRIATCVAAMLQMHLQDSNDGSGRLFAAACRVVEHDLSDTDGIKAIREYARQRSFPTKWTDDQILDRIRDAERKAKRGEVVDEGLISLGTRDPQTQRLVLAPRKTLPTAEAFIREFHQHLGGRTLHSYAGSLWAWRGNRFVEIEEEALRQMLQPWLHAALRYQFNKQTTQMELVDFESNPSTIRAAVESIRAHTYLPVSVTPPCWLDDRVQPKDPKTLLAYPSGTLDLTTGAVLAPTPALFNINAIDFDFDPHPEPPDRWIKFLEQLWDEDLESVQLLQEWMGYCLVADTSQQKMLLMVGPKRSGKGTIGRLLTRLVGAGNVVGPTTSCLAGPFGLQPLIGKSLAIVSDARFSGEHVGVVVERLLCISGEDTLTVDRKFLGSVSMRLPTRFMFLTNELPRMHDASGALAGRFVVLRLIKSFYGHEDIALTQQLMRELPGILVWAIEGLKRLRVRGHFIQPQAVADAVQEMEDLASPVLAFVRDCCEVGAGRRTWIDDMHEAWKRWCERDGRNTVTNRQVFGRDLAAAVPGVVCRRHSVQGRFYDGIALRTADTT